MKILIAGAGIGGLCAALCFARQGQDVVILERAAALGEVGAGIQIPPNAMKVLRALGIEDRIRRDAVEPHAIEARMGRSGRTIFTVPLASHAERIWGAPYLHIHRADYIEALQDSLPAYPNIELRLGVAVTNLELDERAVSVRLSDGTVETGDMLIGADGIHSRVRDWMLGPDKPVYTGNIAWRAVVPIEALGEYAPEQTACVWMGPRRHAVTYRLRRGILANFVGVVEKREPVAETWSQTGRKSDAVSDFSGWHPIVTRLIEAAPEDALFRWALYDRPPLPHWTRGRVALLGDAAHPMLPFLAQGAAMATEDAWVLAQSVADQSADVVSALRHYQDQRLTRTARVQAGARANAKTFHKQNLATQLATYGPMWLAGKMAPPIIRNRLSWLYSHDVTDGE